MKILFQVMGNKLSKLLIENIINENTKTSDETIETITTKPFINE